MGCLWYRQHLKRERQEPLPRYATQQLPVAVRVTNLHSIGTTSAVIGVIIYVLSNWSYTAAVFTPPGSTTNDDGYGLLPLTQSRQPEATSFTVKSNGEIRFCKKCQARKPDRAHHCSTCRRCVLKMDHHCPWLATCVGLRNYKMFLLFLSYTTLLCLYACLVSGNWIYEEILVDSTYVSTFMPVNYIMLCVFSGVVFIVLGLFTGWHIMLSFRGQTTIECLEKTRYLSPLRKPYQHAHNPNSNMPQAAQQIIDFHANALPGITRPEEGEERRSVSDNRPINGAAVPPPHMSYAERERYQSRLRYEEYLDEQDSEKLPNAFDLGWKRNMKHLLGPSPWLWFLPISNTTGDGWSWDPNPKWTETRDRLRTEREQQRQREINAGWGGIEQAGPPPPIERTVAASKADRILGRGGSPYGPASGSSHYTHGGGRARTIEQELDEIDNDEE